LPCGEFQRRREIDRSRRCVRTEILVSGDHVRGAAVACVLMGKEARMLYTIAIILLIAWLLGIVGTYTIGAFVHVLLVIALVLFIVGLVSGRRTVV
jgi:hypothetical protein